MMVASANSRMAYLKGAWLDRMNHLNFGGHQPCLWNSWSS